MRCYGNGKNKQQTFSWTSHRSLKHAAYFQSEKCSGAVRFEWFILCPLDVHSFIWEMWNIIIPACSDATHGIALITL